MVWDGGKWLGGMLVLGDHVAGDYKATVYTPGGSDNFYQETEEYWGTGAGANGIVSGPLTAPNTANADFHAIRLTQLWSCEFEVEAAACPPGDGGVRGEVGLAEDG